MFAQTDFGSHLVRFIRIIIETLKFPRENLKMTFVVLAILIVLVAILTLSVLLVYHLMGSFVRRHKKAYVIKRRQAKQTPDLVRKRWMGMLILILTMSLIVVLTEYYTSKPLVCGRCHQSEFSSWKTSSHSKQDCLSCHREPGVSGYLIHKLDYTRWLLKSTFRNKGNLSEANVVNSACLKCHSVEKRVIESDVRVRHADFLDHLCINCHNTVGHKETIRVPRNPEMTACLVCHNGKKAEARCNLCHPGDISRMGKKVRPRDRFVKIVAPIGKNCRGCHDMKTCNACHGLEMPHPSGWVPGHARPGFTQKDICFRCHPGSKAVIPYGYCNQCHRFPGPHGPSREWIKKHGLAAAKEIRGIKNCRLCHTNERFCDLCHMGKREKINYSVVRTNSFKSGTKQR